LYNIYDGFSKKYYISSDTAELVVNNAPNDYFDEAESEENAYLLIIFSEGLFGYYLTSDQVNDYDWEYTPEIETGENKINSSVLEKIGNDLDLKVIEHSKNNTLILSCNEDLRICKVNRGGEWENVAVVPNPWPQPIQF
jgi:hypothetical protein